jgi:hypothetical protein
MITVHENRAPTSEFKHGESQLNSRSASLIRTVRFEDEEEPLDGESSNSTLFPYTDNRDVLGRYLEEQRRAVDPPDDSHPFKTEIYLSCDLEELFRGCKKEMYVDQKFRHRRSGRIYTESKKFRCRIPPGAGEGYRMVFWGSDVPSKDSIPSDVHIIVTEAENSKFQREGDDLRTYLQITVDDARHGFKRIFRTIEGRPMRLERRRFTLPGYVEVYPQLGMPLCGRATERGDLRVEIDVPEWSVLDDGDNPSLPFLGYEGLEIERDGIVYDALNRQVGLLILGVKGEAYGCTVRENGDIFDGEGTFVGQAQTFRNYHRYNLSPRRGSPPSSRWRRHR